jgi:diguanylate cyclase (GGDEF)-like protein/PAS domain S-box-containing protein
MFGYQYRELDKVDYKILLSKENIDEFERIKHTAMVLKTQSGEFKFKHKNDRMIICYYSLGNFFVDEDKKGFSGILRDITEQKSADFKARKLIESLAIAKIEKKRADELEVEISKRVVFEKKLKETKEKSENYLNIAEVIIATVDIRGEITMINQKGISELGYLEEELLGENWINLLVANDDRYKSNEIFHTILDDSLKGFEYYEAKLLTKNGKEKLFAFHNSLLFDDHGNINSILTSATDISKYREYEQQIEDHNKKLREIAYYDNLTGLLNRQPFMDILEKNILRSKRNGTKLAVLFLDLEEFKNVNDVYGHDVGDEVLKFTGKVIKKHVRKSDVIGRIGGDEFVVLLNDVASVTGVCSAAGKINTAFDSNIILNDLSLSVTASIGIALYPDDGGNADELLKNSDIAMYKAKREGRNNFQLFSIKLKNDVIMEQELCNVLEKDELLLQYQPIFDNKGKCCFAEALLRWESQKFGYIMPLDFIPMLEKNRGIINIGEWVFKEACKQAADFQKIEELKHIIVTVNVSLEQIESDDFISRIKKIIHETKVDASKILIELTERTKIQDITKVSTALIEIKKLGILIALDDFGIGYSSFSNILKLPIDIVKIDKYFIDRIFSVPSSELTSGMITMLKKIETKIIAEGIESKSQFIKLKQMGCDYFQGFYFSRPISDIKEILMKTNKIL